jgi:hypothetical protein
MQKKQSLAAIVLAFDVKTRYTLRKLLLTLSHLKAYDVFEILFLILDQYLEIITTKFAGELERLITFSGMIDFILRIDPLFILLLYLLINKLIDLFLESFIF